MAKIQERSQSAAEQRRGVFYWEGWFLIGVFLALGCLAAQRWQAVGVLFHWLVWPAVAVVSFGTLNAVACIRESQGLYRPKEEVRGHESEEVFAQCVAYTVASFIAFVAGFFLLMLLQHLR